MGMLLRQYHDQENGTRKPGAEVKGRTRKGRRRGGENRSTGARGTEQTPDTPPAEPATSPYAELTDEQLEQAYTVNVDGTQYPGRDEAIRQLDALDAENKTEA